MIVEGQGTWKWAREKIEIWLQRRGGEGADLLVESKVSLGQSGGWRTENSKCVKAKHKKM